MLDSAWARLRRLYRFLKRVEKEGFGRARRFEQREVNLFLTWIEDTRNLIRVSILLFVPLLIGVVTAISNSVGQLSFLLFPPLAAGTYTLFANPMGRYASPRRFVAGLTIGALCGWVALEIGLLIHGTRLATLHIDAAGAALSVLLTGVVIWALDIEEPAAFSSALLVLVTKTSPLAYVISIALSSTLVAAVFVAWKQRFYRQRSRYLYRSTGGGSRALVPMREAHQSSTSLLAGRLVGADSPSEVVLVDVVDDEAIADRERDLYEATRDDSLLAPEGLDEAGADERSELGPTPAGRLTPVALAEQRACEEAVSRLGAEADRVSSTLDVSCEVVVATGSNPAKTVLETARTTECDLIVTSYEEEEGTLSGFVNGLFGGDLDVVVHRAVEDRSRWDRILVPVRRGGDVANRMVGFASRLAGATSQVSVCHCIDSESDRSRAESMLSYLVEQFPGNLETRVSRLPIEDFLAKSAPQYDLIMLGAGTDRSAVSRFIIPPTFERVADVDCDTAIVHRG